MLQSILSIGNTEQNASYPPVIYQGHYNVATSLLLDALVKGYPNSPSLIDIIDPFVGFTMIPVNNGFVSLPDDYRNILGSPYIFAKPDNSGPCGQQPEIQTQQQFQVAINKAGCKGNALTIVPEAEFTLRINSTYNYPDHEYPIAFFSGKKQLKICPYDIPKIYLLYATREPTFVYGYVPQPDDTYVFDISTSTESIWGSNAFSYLFKAISHLYGIYTRDQEVKDWARILTQESIL